MALLPPVCPLDGARFTYNKVTRTLSAFESDLRSQSFDGTYHWIQRLFDDACDEGAYIRSQRTQHVEAFYLERREISPDGDLLAFHLKPVNNIPGLNSVIIFND
jgi:hypothetical protein